MKLPMKSTPKWLFVPPAVAILLILGPLSMQGGTAAPPRPAAAEAAPPEATAEPGARSGRTAPAAPRTPDFWQTGSALLGVLLLGGAGLFGLRRLRGSTPPSGGAKLVGLRQTLRLSPRQALHAVEFDDRILLVGEHERGLVLIDRGRLPDAPGDEREVLARAAAAEDDGAVPKDLVIPRPTAAARPTPAARLNDFRHLLQKAGR